MFYLRDRLTCLQVFLVAKSYILFLGGSQKYLLRKVLGEFGAVFSNDLEQRQTTALLEDIL